MARQARGKSMDPAKVQVFHTVQRCVRRAFLCGEDTVDQKGTRHLLFVLIVEEVKVSLQHKLGKQN